MRSFKDKVLEVVAKISKGEILSYKQVAEMAGSPKAYRAVGNILAKNFNSKIPCHRVIKNNGQPGNYNRGAQNKIKILEKERPLNLMTKYTKQQTKDLQQIMDGQEEEMIPLLKYVPPKNIMDRYLPSVFSKLAITPKTTILDLACGQGIVSVGLALKYRARVIGYDIVPDYIKLDNTLAKKKKIGRLCEFQLGDGRDIVKKKNICDVLLWFAPPKIFSKTKSTVKALRNPVRNNGFIVIADAYLLPGARDFGPGPTFYENLENANKGCLAFGDKIFYFRDFGGSLWQEDYKKTKELYRRAVKKAKTVSEKAIMRRALKHLDKMEAQDTKNLGVAIWVVKIKK